MLIERASSETAEVLCRKIMADLPDYFGLPFWNDKYALGVKSKCNFVAKIEDCHAGLLSLDFPYFNNANIYWMGVLHRGQGRGVGQALINEVCIFAKQKGAKTITVETLAPQEANENYLKTYRFYEKLGFKPLFNLMPMEYECNMVYMIKILGD